MTYTLYHNPRCSKSRTALQLLEQEGADVTIIEYLKTPLDAKSLRSLVGLLGIPVRDMMRRSEAPYKDLGLADAEEDTLIAAMAAHPILIERPILADETRAVIARPPEKILNFIENNDA